MNNEFLIRRAKKDDKDAFCRLMDEHLQCMYKMASAYLKNDEDVADAIQDTILSCYENLRSLKQNRYFKTWMLRILINKCKDILKQKKQVTYTDQMPETPFYEEEYAANLFAGMLLMPEISFRRMYLKFKEESDSNEVDTIIRLMAYYEVPFMAVLIRCLELRLIAGNAVTEGLLNHDRTQIKQKLADLWLDEAIMEPSKKDDYLHVEAIVKKFGKKYVEDGYINERTLDKVLHNMRELYQKIRRE